MKRRSKAFTALAAAMALAWASGARADSNNADNSDALTLTVTPNINYSVDITTSDADMALGSVNLGASTWTVRPATVTFGGNVLTGHELTLTAAITSAGGTPWGFDITPATGSNISADPDKLALFALFSSTMLAAAPSGNSFGDPSAGNTPGTTAAVTDGDGNSSVGPVKAGGDGGNGLQFEYHDAVGINSGEKDMDDNKVGAAMTGGTDGGIAHLWFLLRLPSTTTSGAQQSIQVTLTHTLGAGN